MTQSIQETQGDIRVCDPPEKWTEMRVGLDRPDFPEARWQIGKTDDRIAIRFMQYPDFPLWVCGKPFDDALHSEPFLQE